MPKTNSFREEFEKAFQELKENKGPCTKCHKVHESQPYPFKATEKEKKENWVPQWHDPIDGHAYYAVDPDMDKFELALWAAKWALKKAAEIAKEHGDSHSNEADRIEKMNSEQFAEGFKTQSSLVAALASTSMECYCIAEAITKEAENL